MNFVKPIIERFGEDIPIDKNRKHAAEDICKYLRNCDPAYLPKYYSAAELLLNRRSSERILLYLPFQELRNAPESFKNAYICAWSRLLRRYDVRENFHKGDIFEEDARPNGKLELAIKCVHLVPWMIEAGYLDPDELESFLKANNSDNILIRSFRDVLPYISDHYILAKMKLDKLYFVTKSAPPRERLEPSYISDNRRKWLIECKNEPSEMLTPNAHLEGPFSPNLEFIADDISKIAEKLEPDDIVLLGGSRLKGYGVSGSDFDIWNLKELEADPELYPGSLHAIHIYFNSVWIGGNAVKNLASISFQTMWNYFGSGNQRIFLERLENDLLQYRLLHKGYSRFTGKKHFETEAYLDMDGDCPFYDDNYRRIATMLYAKYLLVPD